MTTDWDSDLGAQLATAEKNLEDALDLLRSIHQAETSEAAFWHSEEIEGLFETLDETL